MHVARAEIDRRSTRIPNRKARRHVALVSTVVGLATILLAGCSSSSASQAAPAGGSPSGASSSSLTGPAVTFMLIGDATAPPGGQVLLPLASFKAAVAGVNARGGVNGHPLQMELCDAQTNPNVTASCARKAVSEKVPAVLSYVNNGGSYLSILQKAGIPDINQLASADELTSPNSYGVGSGALGSTAGFGTAAVHAGCKQAAYIAVLPPAYAAAAQGAFATFQAVAKTAGIKTSSVIQAPPGAADFSPYLENAVQQHADCIVFLASGPADSVGIVKAAKQANITAKLITASSSFTPKTIASLGSQLDGVLVDDLAWPASAAAGHPGVEQFVNDIKAYSSDPSYLGTDAECWMNVQLLAHVADQASPISAASITAALNKLHDYDPGLDPPESFDAAPPNPAAPRVFSNAVLLGHFEGGKVVPDGFFDISTAKPVPFA